MPPLIAALVLLASCRSNRSTPTDRPTFTDGQLEVVRTLSPLPAVPNDATNRVSGDPAAVHFGRFLFFDERLSSNGEVSCASCHRPNHGFSVPTDKGRGLGRTPRHPPSLLNVAHHQWYDWDGKADSLWAQAARPIENPSEMGATRTAVVRTIHADKRLHRAYEAVFGEMPDLSDGERFDPRARPTPDRPNSAAHRAWKSMSAADRRTVNRVFSNVLKAIAAYETRLVSGDAPFDRWVRALDAPETGRSSAMTAAAERSAGPFCVVD
ncbi:MAG: cytochrome-c peroxidase, partial [Bradymonadaceae bacterium]